MLASIVRDEVEVSHKDFILDSVFEMNFFKNVIYYLIKENFRVLNYIVIGKNLLEGKDIDSWFREHEYYFKFQEKTKITLGF